MHNLRLCALWAFAAPAALLAQTTTSGTVAVGGGAASVDGDVPAFQQATQHKKDGYGGIEEFTLLREGKDSLLKFDLRLIPGDDDYLVGVRYDFRERFYVDAGYEQYRVFYDGSGGYFSPRDLQFVLYDEDLSLLRTKVWTELGATIENGTYFKLRYERLGRDGTKGSTRWGDSNLTGISTNGTRRIVPAFFDIDEVTNTFSFEAGNETREESKWNAGASYSQTELDDKLNARRRPNESASRYVTSKDTSTADIFAAHGYYLRRIGEKLTLSGGALITDIDSNISGSRIYGQSYDPVYDPGYANRQQRDEGFYDLEGGAEMKQTVLNLNAVYTPRKNWSIRPSLRFENQHQETMVDFMETNIGGGPAFAASREEVEAESEREFDEFSEEIEVRYTGRPNWTFIGAAQFVQTSGDLKEKRTPHNLAPNIDRDTEITRDSQKYSLTSNWYARPGLTFAAQYYFKVKINDYDAVRDNTIPTGGDRYPAFITDQDFETNDFNFRVSWRPVPLLNLVTRYDYQRSTVVSVEAGLQKGLSSEYSSQILSQNITWSPTSRLYLTGNVNFTSDEIATPAYAFVQTADNNYINGSVGGGYALAELDDLYLDYTWFDASNFTDTATTSMPFNLTQNQQAVTLTWVRRQTEHLVYTVKYGYITNDDTTSGGRNDFDAHTIYAKVQYSF